MNRQPTVLVVDSHLDDIALALQTIRNEGYEVVTASDGEQALEFVKRTIPDVILLDVAIPGLGGLFLCRKLKSVKGLGEVPVIFITSSSTPEDVGACFEAGGNDYVAKPVNRTELLARVRTHLELREATMELARLRQTPLDISPLTKLPGSNPVAWTIQDALDQQAEATVIYCDLDDFKAYNERYGYYQGDRVLKFVGEVLEKAVQTTCRSEGFVGHIGGDDFVLVVASDHAEALGKEIVRRFDEGIESFYQKRDREKGGIMTADRRGRVSHFPFMTISMAGVPLVHHDFKLFLEVSVVGASAMQMAKSTPGSNLFLDRRKLKSMTP